MAPLRSLMNRLESCVAADLEGQRRIAAALGAVQEAVLRRDREALGASGAALEREVAGGRRRNAQRTTVLAALAAHWNVARPALTLRSVAERFGPGVLGGPGEPGAERLLALRDDLRAASAEVVRASRRTFALLALHRDLLRETLELLLGASGENPLEVEGAILDAEG